MNYTQSTALELARAIREGKVTSPELVRAAKARIEAVDGDIHAMTALDWDAAMQRAEEIQARIDKGEDVGPLAGVPMAIKDNICMRGLPAACGSKMLLDFDPPYDATAVGKLLDAGAVIVGHTNMDEFAMGSTTETSFHGATHNPWDLGKTPGGSSGGSAAAVAACELPCALGSDTGGSIRQPASFCGVTGFKPTYGAVSRYGLIAYASSLDQIGPLARDAADCAAIYDVIHGKDVHDATTVDSVCGALEALDGDVRGLRVGVPEEYFAEGLDEDVRARVLEAAETLKSLGAQVETFSLGMVKYAVPAYYILACAEASSNLSRFDGIKYGYRADEAEDIVSLMCKSRTEGFGKEVRRRILLGTFVLSSGYYDAYYVKALKVKALIKQAFDAAFEKYDVILSPAAPTTALGIGQSLSDPLKMYLGDIYTVSVNLAGLPAVTFPCGFDRDGMPVGAQLIGAAHADKTVLRAADAFQRATEFHKMTKGGAL
ncbi:MAG: Asp-tRNA(Asn)/Glu-tRNA(Gln) amidotransferase subunit GatA [Candidatus Spyradocola sp.]|nr:Asp-tRNA(Asn)/Glu-tRNA(Gln) amidotransferase subunit GatA [Candidatus Spyradocola sp.]